MVRSADDFPTSSCDWLKQKLENWFDLINDWTNSKNIFIIYLISYNLINNSTNSQWYFYPYLTFNFISDPLPDNYQMHLTTNWWRSVWPTSSWARWPTFPSTTSNWTLGSWTDTGLCIQIRSTLFCSRGSSLFTIPR